MKPDDYRRLVSLGLNPDQIAGVMEIMDAKEEDRKAKQRARWRKHQQNKKNANVSQRELTIANVPRERITRVEDKTSNSGIEPQEENKKRAQSALEGFEDWYRVYPHKVQRGAAERAWPKARSQASLEELIAGVHRYVANKPPDRPYQNPATWLNGKGWLDEPGAVAPKGQGPPKAPQIADVFAFVGKQGNGQERDDSGGIRAAIPHLSAIGSRGR